MPGVPTIAARLAVTTSLVLVTTAVPITAGSATAMWSATARGCATGAGDFDGNGGVDLALNAPVVGADGDVAQRPGFSRKYYPPSGQVDVVMRYRKGLRTVIIPRPTTVQGHSVRTFGDALAELDLSAHTRASQPCAALAITGSYGRPRDPQSAIFLYRWHRASHSFARIATLTGPDIGVGLEPFGRSLASQTMSTNRPQPRARVLYASVGGPSDIHAVVRLTLSPHGTVESKQLIAPGPSATSNVPISDADAGGGFGYELLGTPDPNQVIIGDPDAATSRGGGAVIVWNKGTESQLLTPESVGVPEPSGTRASLFGSALFLTTEAAQIAGDSTLLMIGAPEFSIPGTFVAGVAVQLRYDRTVTPGRVVTSNSKVWSQNTKGVAGKSDAFDEFGSAFTALVAGRHTVVLTSAPGEHDKRGTGVVDALGTYQVWHASSLGQKQLRSLDNDGFGYSLSSLHDITDRLPHDPFPQTTRHAWAGRAVVATPGDDWISVGLPTKGSRHFTVLHFRGAESCASDIGCEFGERMTSSLGG